MYISAYRIKLVAKCRQLKKEGLIDSVFTKYEYVPVFIQQKSATIF